MNFDYVCGAASSGSGSSVSVSSFNVLLLLLTTMLLSLHRRQQAQQRRDNVITPMAHGPRRAPGALSGRRITMTAGRVTSLSPPHVLPMAHATCPAPKLNTPPPPSPHRTEPLPLQGSPRPSRVHNPTATATEHRAEVQIRSPLTTIITKSTVHRHRPITESNLSDLF